MDKCYIYCIIAFALFYINVYMMRTPQTQDENNFITSLSENQLQRYLNITQTRAKIYIEGLILGVILAMLGRLYISDKINYSCNICVFSATIMVTSYVYYLMSKKPDLMENHLQTEEQKAAWKIVNNKMKSRFHQGIAISAIISLSLALFII